MFPICQPYSLFLIFFWQPEEPHLVLKKSYFLLIGCYLFRSIFIFVNHPCRFTCFTRAMAWSISVYPYPCVFLKAGRRNRYSAAISGALGGYDLAANTPLNRFIFVKRKDNLLSAGADHVYPLIIVYQSVVWLFYCILCGFSIRYLPAVLPIKR